MPPVVLEHIFLLQGPAILIVLGMLLGSLFRDRES
jgi:hypothetical protein